jgi:hypothetical protein
MKAITLMSAFLVFSLTQGCDDLINTLSEKDELEIRATGEECVSDYNTYHLDSGTYSVHVSFTGMTDVDSVNHYHPLIIIRSGGGTELGSFIGADEIKGYHSEVYSVYSTEVEVYAELRQNHNPMYYDTAVIKLTGISVY